MTRSKPIFRKVCAFLLCLLACPWMAQAEDMGAVFELKPTDYALPPGKFSVYSSPGEAYLRGAGGTASVSGREPVSLFGREGDWLLLRYEIFSEKARIGYVRLPGLADASIPVLDFQPVPACLRGDVSVTDDPGGQAETLTWLSDDMPVLLLATLGAYAYIETQTPRRLRGFVPQEAVATGESRYAEVTVGDLRYPLFEVTRFLYDAQGKVVAVEGAYERILQGEEYIYPERAEGSERRYRLADDFMADMVGSMSDAQSALCRTNDLDAWYRAAYLGEEDDGCPLRFQADLPPGDEETPVDFWFVTTKIELNEADEIRFMRWVYVPWA